MFVSVYLQSDFTIVVDDFAATNNSEVSVRKGQQVEVIELSPGQPNWCFVKTLQNEGVETFQGLVPTATLKPIPRLLGPGSRSSLEFEGNFFLFIVNHFIDTDDGLLY